MMTELVLKGRRGVKMDWLVIHWGQDNVDDCQVGVRDGTGGRPCLTRGKWAESRGEEKLNNQSTHF